VAVRISDTTGADLLISISTCAHKWEVGFKKLKLAIPYGPADGREGIRKNEELVKRAPHCELQAVAENTGGQSTRECRRGHTDLWEVAEGAGACLSERVGAVMPGAEEFDFGVAL